MPFPGPYRPAGGILVASAPFDVKGTQCASAGSCGRSGRALKAIFGAAFRNEAVKAEPHQVERINEGINQDARDVFVNAIGDRPP